MEPLLSVIIPVYNVAPYLEKCLRSVVNQTYKNMEIILVDDGSTDGSGEMCDRYREMDKRICVIHQPNGGLSVARNTGLDQARGEYIAFLDSDDWIDLGMYEVMVDVSRQYGADIVSCASVNEYVDRRAEVTKDEPGVIKMDYTMALESLVSNQYVRMEVWNKIWKRDLIGDIRFIPKQVSEDVHFCRKLFPKANFFVAVRQPMHHYLASRPGNTCSTFKIARMATFWEFECWISELQRDSKFYEAELLACYAVSWSIFVYVNAMDTKQKKEITQKIEDYFEKFYLIARNCKYCDRKAFLFHVSPKMYYYLLKLKQRSYK